MATDPQAETLARIALRKKLIETAKKRIEKSYSLSERSHRLIRFAMGHDVDGEGAKSQDD